MMATRLHGSLGEKNDASGFKVELVTQHAGKKIYKSILLSVTPIKSSFT